MAQNKKKAYNVTFDNLAIPEIQTGMQPQKSNGSPKETSDKNGHTQTTVTYDTVAIPEVHVIPGDK